MFKTIIVAVTLLFIVTACTSKQVYIINHGYSAKDIAALSLALKNINVVVHESDILIPKSFSSTVIATNPSFNDSVLLAKIKLILNEFNMGGAEHFQLAQGRHFYSSGNIGLYLRNDNNFEPIMPAYLRTQDCASEDATLMFKRSGEFILEYEANPIDNEELISFHGHFLYDGKQLRLLVNENVIQQFTYHQEMKNTHLGDRLADVYIPNLSASQPVLNCEFLIIYMN